jgi:hypothetical protein
MANAFMIHGLRPDSSLVDPILMVICTRKSCVLCWKLVKKGYLPTAY